MHDHASPKQKHRVQCMAATASSDRLSDLPNDVLIHVLSFLPSKEAARTTTLSRRWRHPLWLDTGAVNLDSRGGGGASPASDADHALACFHRSHGRVPTKVTVVMRNGSMHDDVLRAAACRRDVDDAVQDLRLDCKDGGWPPCWIWMSICKSCSHCTRCIDPLYSLPPDSLPSAALRALDLSGCHLKMPLPSVAFPCLAALRLRLCAMELATLQDMVSAAPKLADLRLESLSIDEPWPCDRHLRLGCPAATAVAVINIVVCHSDGCTLELDAPRLRRLRYTQHVCFGALGEVSFKSPPPDGLERVDVQVRSRTEPMRSVLGIHDCHARVLKLTVFSVADNRCRIFPDFPNLELLEIEELCGCLDDRAAAADAMMQMLRCCPAIRELRLKFTYLDGTSVDPADHAAAMSELTTCRSLFRDDGDDGGRCCEISYFPAGSPHTANVWSTDLWRNSLRKVAVRSDVEELTCFQVQLVRYLARNANSLEEVDIVGAAAGGNNRRDVEEWRHSPCTASQLADCASPRRPQQPPPPMSLFPPLGILF